MPAQISKPVLAQYPAEKLTIGAGVAIFHLASERVVVCYHSKENYWFLPKGRRNGNEETTRGAEREGFEESGYRNRVLPLPIKHRQPDPDEGYQRFVTEPIWTQFLPLTSTAQYLLFWYAAETVPRDVEEGYTAALPNSEPAARMYKPPAPFPSEMTLRQRVAMDTVVGDDGTTKVYEPFWHEGTGVDEDELLYTSHLLSIDEARRRLRGSVQEDVIRRAWEAIQLRLEMEAT
jgi:ADP-ribose pyrophosphatase YjhB (NUDIX family)